MMLSKDFPLTHDITGKDKKKQGKQVGSQPKGWGSIYVAESENCAVKELSNGEWTCFKIGLASDGEASSFKIKCDQATGNSGNYSQVRNYPVKNVGKTKHYVTRYGDKKDIALLRVLITISPKNLKSSLISKLVAQSGFVSLVNSY